MKIKYFIIPVFIVILLSMLAFRYKRYDQSLVHKGHSIQQRYDRLRRVVEVGDRDKWVRIEDWKRETENIFKETERKRKYKPSSTIEPTKLSQEVMGMLNRGKDR